MHPNQDQPETAAKKPELHLGTFAGPAPTPTGDPEGATMIIRRAAVETASRVVESGADGGTDSDLPLEVMLGLISYCYARGIFRSDDIARRLREQPELAKEFGRDLPDAQAIRRFRRRHADAIEETLETLYRAMPEDPSADTVVIERQAKDRVHDAAFTDNTSR